MTKLPNSPNIHSSTSKNTNTLTNNNFTITSTSSPFNEFPINLKKLNVLNQTNFAYAQVPVDINNNFLSSQRPKSWNNLEKNRLLENATQIAADRNETEHELQAHANANAILNANIKPGLANKLSGLDKNNKHQINNFTENFKTLESESQDPHENFVLKSQPRILQIVADQSSKKASDSNIISKDQRKSITHKLSQKFYSIMNQNNTTNSSTSSSPLKCSLPNSLENIQQNLQKQENSLTMHINKTNILHDMHDVTPSYTNNSYQENILDTNSNLTCQINQLANSLLTKENFKDKSDKNNTSIADQAHNNLSLTSPTMGNNCVSSLKTSTNSHTDLPSKLTDSIPPKTNTQTNNNQLLQNSDDDSINSSISSPCRKKRKQDRTLIVADIMDWANNEAEINNSHTLEQFSDHNFCDSNFDLIQANATQQETFVTSTVTTSNLFSHTSHVLKNKNYTNATLPKNYNFSDNYPFSIKNKYKHKNLLHKQKIGILNQMSQQMKKSSTCTLGKNNLANYTKNQNYVNIVTNFNETYTQESQQQKKISNFSHQKEGRITVNRISSDGVEDKENLQPGELLDTSLPVNYEKYINTISSNRSKSSNTYQYSQTIKESFVNFWCG